MPAIKSAVKQAIIDIGIDNDTISVERQLRRKNRITTIANNPP
jgi:hypothetical protein